MGLQLST